MFETLQLVAVVDVLLILVRDGDKGNEKRILVVFQLDRFSFVQHPVELNLFLFGLFT